MFTFFYNTMFTEHTSTRLNLFEYTPKTWSRLCTPLGLFMVCMLLPKVAFMQCNTAQCPMPMQSVNAQNACVNPSPASLDCYYGQTTQDAPESFPPSWCTTIENNHFFAFVADAPTTNFTIAAYGCASGAAVQAAVLSTADCINFQFVSPCLGNIASGSQQVLTASGLTPGETYYIMIDGSAGAICDYSINATLPTITGPVNGICIPNPPVTYTTNTQSVCPICPDIRR
jgi:hypothetical protein